MCYKSPHRQSNHHHRSQCSTGLYFEGFEYSSSPSNFLIFPDCEESFSKRFDFAAKIGHVDKEIKFVLNNEEKLTFSIEELRKLWTEPLWNRLA